VHVQRSLRVGAELSAGVAVQIAVAVAGARIWLAYQIIVRIQIVACVVRSCDRSSVVAGKTVLAQVTSGWLSDFDIVLCVASLLRQILLVQRATPRAGGVADLDLVWPVNNLTRSWTRGLGLWP